MKRDVAEIEFLESGRSADEDPDAVAPPQPTHRLVGPVVVVLLAIVAGLLAVTATAEPEASDSAPSDTPEVEHRSAAESFTADPTASSLRRLFDELGGFEGLSLGSARGAFDLVRFDPANADRLLAAHRSSYGEADNSDTNELWTRSDDGSITQTAWSPDVPHDFVHFNRDGTTTMWAHGGGAGFAPRQATLLDDDGQMLRSFAPIYAYRFAFASATMFALTGNGDYYSNDTEHLALVADTGDGPRVLSDAEGFGWIDVPSAGVLLAYPTTVGGGTAVWNTETLEPWPSHPLAGRGLQRASVSGDGTLAVAVTLDGQLIAIDLATGVSTEAFGQVDIVGVDEPIAVNGNGTVAVTVERTGTVTIWWVGDRDPVAAIAADAGQPRWVSERFAPTAASVVAHDAGRLALRTPATATSPTHYRLIDLDIDSWLRRSCALTNDPCE